MNAKEFLRFRMKVAEAARAPLTEQKFVEALEGLVKHGQRLLNGEYRPPSEREVEDGAKDFGRFVSDQKVVDFTTQKGIVLEKMHKWWWLREQRTGECRDLPGLRGFARITNGLVMYIEDSSGATFLVHNDNFKFDRVESDSSNSSSTKVPKSAQRKGGLSRVEFEGLLE